MVFPRCPGATFTVVFHTDATGSLTGKGFQLEWSLVQRSRQNLTLNSPAMLPANLDNEKFAAGAVYAVGTSILSIDSCLFLGNSLHHTFLAIGAAVVADSFSNIVISRSVFSSNRAVANIVTGAITVLLHPQLPSPFLQRSLPGPSQMSVTAPLTQTLFWLRAGALLPSPTERRDALAHGVPQQVPNCCRESAVATIFSPNPFSLLCSSRNWRTAASLHIRFHSKLCNLQQL